MYRRSSHEPRYKHSTRVRHAESSESSEESSSSEEDEESTDVSTGESEFTVGTQETRSFQDSEGRPNRRKSRTKFDNSDKFHINSYFGASEKLKKDQYTQKNLLSPFPSYSEAPIRREVTGAPYYRVSNAMPASDDRNHFQNEGKSAAQVPRKKETHGGEEAKLTKKNQERTERQFCEKHKPMKDERALKLIQPQIIRCDRHGNKMEFSRKSSKPTVETENLPKKSVKTSEAMGVSIRRPKISSREMECIHLTSKKCPACSRGFDSQLKLRRKPGIVEDASPFERDPKIRDVIIEKETGDGNMVRSRGKEVKEKLMYVVEEEGKSTTKIETDLFSVNEILTIKKDLIELSEFAKKLKKLKEKKKDPESEKSKGNSCQCQVPEGLLKDVNKRIEALETRQAELERKSRGISNKGDLGFEPKKTVCPVTPSTSPPKTPVVAKPSALTTVQSVPKTEMVTRAAVFPFSTDIVNELMDIKIQLEKLEKKRMLKNGSEEKETNIPNTKEHAIAVFSSKTYILTNENYDKNKNGKGKSKKELMKENVANWLKNVSLERTDNELGMFLSPDGAKGEESILEKKKRLAEIKCKTCNDISKQENFENQEPQKKKMPEHLGKGGDVNIAYPFSKRPSEGFKMSKKRKKCFMTPSGRFFTILSESSQDVTRRFSKVQQSDRGWPSSKGTGRRSSSGSIPSTVFIKQQLKKLKSHWNKKRGRENVNVIRKKSIQELSESSSTSKSEESSRGHRMKSSESFNRDKRCREGKKELMKRLETHFIALAKNLGRVDPTSSSYSYSELLASVNLESDQMTLDTHNPQESFHRNNIFMYTAATKEDDAESVECCQRETKKSRTKKSKKKKKAKKCKSDSSKRSKRRSCEKKCKDEEKAEKKRLKRLKKALKKQRKRCRRKCRKPRPSCCKRKCIECLLKTPVCSRHKVPSCRTECSCSQATRETFDCKEPPPEPPCPTSEPIAREKCHKTCKRSGLIRESFDISVLRKILKNLSHYYPKLGNMKYCSYNDAHPKCSKRGKRSCFKLLRSESAGRFCYCENDRNPCKSHSNTNVSSCNCRNCHQQESSHQHSCQHHSAHRLYRMDNCKCVRLFLEQTEPKFPNFKPFQILPEESKTDVSTSSRTRISSTSLKSDFVMPKPKPQVYYIGNVSEEQDDRRNRSQQRKRSKKKKKKKCTCDKCGNVHEIVVQEPEPESEPEPEPEPEPERHFEDETASKGCHSSRKGDIFPLFSLFSHFCQSRKSEGGTARRCWSKIKRPSKSKEKAVNDSACGSPCNCKEKFIMVETRLKEVEDEQDRVRQQQNHKSPERKKKPKKEKKSKKKPQSQSKPHKKKEGKKKKKKDETAAYYYTINTPSTIPSILNSSTEPKKSTETIKSSLRFLCKNKKINEGLSSLHSFWKNLRDRRIKNRMEKMVSKMKEKSMTESNELIDDPSRSSQIPRKKQVLELNEEPTSFLKTKHRRKKKEKSTSKRKSKREKHK